MIDFRYHLVSLVSVFVALAVGIVLGSGPLGGQLTETVSAEVDKLRADRVSLRQDLNSAQAEIKSRDDFTSSVMPQLVAGQLIGQSVVLVVLPDADRDQIDALQTALATAGAQVTGRVTVSDPWTAPARATERAQTLARLAPLLTAPTTPTASASASASASATAGAGASPSRSASPTPNSTPSPTRAAAPATLERLLARALTTAASPAPAQLDPAARSILDGLTKAGLIDVDGDLERPAGEVVVLAPSVEQATLAGSQASASASPARDDTKTWTALVTALDAAGRGAVVLGPASSAASGGVVAAVRSDRGAAQAVSTVDTGGTPMGDVTAVLALREQLTGASGAYGFSRSASAPLPVARGTA